MPAAFPAVPAPSARTRVSRTQGAPKWFRPWMLVRSNGQFSWDFDIRPVRASNTESSSLTSLQPELRHHKAVCRVTHFTPGQFRQRVAREQGRRYGFELQAN